MLIRAVNSCVFRKVIAKISFQDRMTKRNIQKQQKQFKQQLQNLSLKSSFTLLDYRQRVYDTLQKSKKGIANMLSQGNQQTQQQLEQQRVIMAGFYDQELNGDQQKLNGQIKRQVALVSQKTPTQVNNVLKKYTHYKKMWKLVRYLKQKNQQLPKDINQLKYLMKNNMKLLTSYRQKQIYKRKKRKTSKKQNIQRVKWNLR